MTMLHGEKYPYKVVLHDHHGKHETVDIVMGQTAAAKEADARSRRLTADQREQGWSHFTERTGEKPWPRPKRPASAGRKSNYKRG